MSRDLAERLQRQFDRFKLFPEAGRQGDYFLLRGDAFIAFLDARELLEREAIPALSGLPPVAPPWRLIETYFDQEPATPDVLVDDGCGLGFWDDDDRCWRDSHDDSEIRPTRWMALPER